jgi:hypothetical protein
MESARPEEPEKAPETPPEPEPKHRGKPEPEADELSRVARSLTAERFGKAPRHRKPDPDE